MIILFGPSASGKTEIGKILMKKYGLKKIVTCTTREPRVNEVNDVDYHFYTKQQFQKALDNNEFVETVNYNNNFYGSLKKEIANDKVVILEPNGVKKYLELNNPSIVTFYTDCPKEVRKARMEGRKDNPENILQRLINDEKDFSKDVLPKSDYIIDTSTKSIEELADEIYSLYSSKIHSL